MSRLVAVTGATGFVGPPLIAALARRGWKLRLLVRRWSPLPSLDGIEAELVLGDLLDEAALRRLVDGADTVIHAAGLIKARWPADFMNCCTVDRITRKGSERSLRRPVPLVAPGCSELTAMARRRNRRDSSFAYSATANLDCP